jgi:hypothetical protein
VRCGRCGNENPEGNRFCGMCAAPLVSKAQADAAPARPAQAAQVTITGPSFLGLSTPGPATERHAKSSSEGDTQGASSRNLDYLLDEEEPKPGHGKLIAVVVALVLALGFGYVYWKQGGFGWLTGGDKKPTVSAPAPEPGPSADSAGAGKQGAPVEAPAPQAAPGQDAASTAAAQNSEVQNTVPASKATDSATPETAPPAAAADTAPAPRDSAPPSRVRKPAAAKPAPAKPHDVVSEAERYIYGRGVRQDCDHGMRLLKSAPTSNPKAMISLGALYSTGTCTPRDLPTAYRWFALALHQQPDNLALQDDLKNLWAKMTPPERQLAIKLSQ